MEGKGWVHATVQKRGHQPEPQRCTKVAGSNLFQCPFCSLFKFKAAKPYKVKIHLAWHVRGAVEYGDYTIYRCGLDCRQKLHFHCPACNATIIRKEDLHRHFGICKQSRFLNSTPTTQAPPAEPPATTPAPPAEPPTPSPAPLAVLPPQNLNIEPCTNTESAEIKKIGGKNRIQVSCPHCNLVLNKKNLKTHVQRKHTKPELTEKTVSSSLNSSPSESS